MKDKHHQKLYHELLAAYDALALKEKALPDTQKEWEHFRQRSSNFTPPHPILRDSHKNQRLILRITTIAAGICLLIGFGLWAYFQPKQSGEPIALVQMNPAPQEVVLSNNQGGEIILSEQTDRDSLASLGATLTKDRKLAYQPADKKNDSSAITTQTLQTPRGKDFKIVLSDGTEVWLNAESTLIYPSRFTGDTRIVELNGEAYFKVAKDIEHPFIVKTQKLETQVLGTGFNVHAYQSSEPHITLVEGKVAIKSQYYHIMLKPGENALLKEDGSIRVQEVDTHCYTAWTEGYFYFDNAPLKDIMQELGRWYNLTIEINNPKAINYHFNFWANRNDNIEYVIDLLNELGKVKASLRENTLTIN